MPSASYQSVFSKIDPSIQTIIKNALAMLFPDPNSGQIQKNVEAETALSVDDFTSFITSFASQLQQGHPPEMSWKTACYAHQFKGPQLPLDAAPATLGRVKGLADHVSSISKTRKALSAGMTSDRTRKLLLKHAGSASAPNLEPMLREALLGEYLIWATFDIADMTQNPFKNFPQTRAALCIALGLGVMLNNNEPLILLVWDHVASGAPALHRPTIADACDYSFFRPCPDPTQGWGMTEPLQPNPEKLMPQPEIVMRATASRGLKLPYIILHA